MKVSENEKIINLTILECKSCLAEFADDFIANNKSNHIGM